MLRALLKDGAMYAIPAFISRGLSLFLVPLYTRVLSPADYGSLDLLMAFASIINLTISLEISQGLARYYGSETDRERKVLYASSAFWFTLASYTLFLVLMWLGKEQLAPLVMGREGLETAFQIGMLSIWIGALFSLIQNQLRWELRSREYAAVSLLMTFVGAAASVWLAYGLRWGMEGLLIGSVLGPFSASILGLWFVRTSFRMQFCWRQLREMLAFSAPLVFSSILIWGSLYIDRILISYFLSVEEVGLYGIGYRLAGIATLIMVGFQTALTPLIYKHYQSPDTPIQLARIFRYFVASVLAVYLALSLFAVDILEIFTSEPFLGGATVVAYLVPAILLANMYIFAPGISLAKRTHYFIWISFGGAVLNILLNVLLIPVFGIVGSAFSTMTSSLAGFTAHMALSQRFYPAPHKWKSITICAAFAFLLAWGFPRLTFEHVPAWAFNMMAIGAWSVIALATSLISLSEVRKLFRIVIPGKSLTR